MFEQIEWTQVGAALLGMLLLIDASLKIVSLRYYCFLYEKPFLRRKSEGHMKIPKIERDAQRYAVTVREIAGGAFLVVWGLGMHESVEGLYAILWGSLGLYMALMIFIWHRERKNK